MHLSTGQEAVAVGVCAHLEKDDLLTSTHRGHGHTLAKGADLKKMMCELYGKAAGTNGGKGGSMHIADFEVGMLGANGVVGAGITIAVGAAHAIKLQKKNQIVACFFGDGAINRGPFLEGLNWAKVFELPVLFVCEDNQISATTQSAHMTAGPGVLSRAQSLGVVTQHVNGNDVMEVSVNAKTLIESVRRTCQPHLLHAVTYRLKGHVSVDKALYRDPNEVINAWKDDPIQHARTLLIQQGHVPFEIDQMESKVNELLQEATQFATAAAYPKPEAAFLDVADCGDGEWY
ncbi:MAG: thiamine pyrophosphate-dependent dehydrogenase E1 component subunit alpha [Limnohabitans sp.]